MYLKTIAFTSCIAPWSHEHGLNHSGQISLGCEGTRTYKAHREKAENHKSTTTLFVLHLDDVYGGTSGTGPQQKCAIHHKAHISWHLHFRLDGIEENFFIRCQTVEMPHLNEQFKIS